MFDVRGDTERNRLTLVLIGYCEAPKVRRAVDAAREALGGLRAGFDVLVDLSGYQCAGEACARELGRVERLAREAGGRRLVRVLGRDVPRAWAPPGRDGGLEIHEVATLLAAEELLAALAV
ncbi:MAG: hypothetical protein JW819_13980 [Candidatus Krumholzibacteriota bacterium]|nr:hypothetical protein [Candidatus Krumholzibacteriota bacterium]